MRYNRGMKNKYPTSMRLTPTAKRLIEQISESLGISNSAVLELAIRTLARQHNIQADTEAEGAEDEDMP